MVQAETKYNQLKRAAEAQSVRFTELQAELLHDKQSLLERLQSKEKEFAKVEGRNEELQETVQKAWEIIPKNGFERLEDSLVMMKNEQNQQQVEWKDFKDQTEIQLEAIKALTCQLDEKEAKAAVTTQHTNESFQKQFTSLALQFTQLEHDFSTAASGKSSTSVGSSQSSEATNKALTELSDKTCGLNELVAQLTQLTQTELTTLRNDYANKCKQVIEYEKQLVELQAEQDRHVIEAKTVSEAHAALVARHKAEAETKVEKQKSQAKLQTERHQAEVARHRAEAKLQAEKHKAELARHKANAQAQVERHKAELASLQVKATKESKNDNSKSQKKGQAESEVTALLRQRLAAEQAHRETLVKQDKELREKLTFHQKQIDQKHQEHKELHEKHAQEANDHKQTRDQLALINQSHEFTKALLDKEIKGQQKTIGHHISRGFIYIVLVLGAALALVYYLLEQQKGLSHANRGVQI